ncbi:TetR/AcrR family transcriptional regulator [Aureibaculum sp. A20]|uniref:TetR/AcrR family transcriptional regulator n=1 Tax=Aureibaculum flavum TaxID=2795986 RepID=A0ABS0WQ46_9FLAO|nr:TetR/AcrR family transcriptional regulator [Aureibaculum flavum]MBJ2174082.1 TetR/AcrR family transcriptional regulator [Aureibaculum flavum]
MITKEELLTCSITKFTQFGSKHVSLDEIAGTLGISKKTIYTFFKNKEDLVTSSLEQLLNKLSEEIDKIISDNREDPIISVILIYKRGFEYLKYFKPSYIFGLKKYYPKASNFFEKFNEDLANNRIYNLLKQAQEAGNIKQEVNLKLVVKIYFLRIDTVLFNNNNLFKLHQKEELFKHMVVYNLKGIITRNYSNPIFE